MKQQSMKETTPPISAPPSLTRSEKEVLRVMATGLNRQETAERLVCSTRTVDFHLHNAYQKLNVSRLMSAVVKARQLGLID